MVVSTVRTDDGAHCEIGGDEVVVLFGLNEDLADACGTALEAAARIELALEAMDDRLAREFSDAAACAG